MKTVKNLKRASEIANKISEIKGKLEANKPLYDELDQLTVELSKEAEPGTVFNTDDHHFVTLTDNFAEKNSVWRPACVKRYEVERLDEAEMIKKLNKKVAAAKKEGA